MEKLAYKATHTVVGSIVARARSRTRSSIGGTLGLGGQAATSALEVVGADYFFDHAHGETLLKATVLAAIAAPLVHRAVLVCQTHVLGVLLHGTLEEALAAFARAHPVVLACGVVAAHSTQLIGRYWLLIHLLLHLVLMAVQVVMVMLRGHNGQ